MTTSTHPTILSPSDAARAMGITTSALVKLLRAGGYAWTELTPGRKPGDLGRAGWGLTGEQFAALLQGQARIFETTTTPEEPGVSLVSPDGRSRLRRSRRSPG